MINDAIRKRLRLGSRMSVDQLAESIGIPRPHVRAAVAEMVFTNREITCDREGFFYVGDPTPLIMMGG